MTGFARYFVGIVAFLILAAGWLAWAIVPATWDPFDRWLAILSLSTAFLVGIVATAIIVFGRAWGRIIENDYRETMKLRNAKASGSAVSGKNTV